MEDNKTLKKNIIMNSISSFISLLYPIITFPYISRILLPNGIGKVNFAISITTYFIMFAQLGIPLYGIRACSELRNDKIKLTKTVLEIFLIYSITTIVSFVLYLFFISNVKKLYLDRELYMILSMLFLLNLIGFEWLFKALEKYDFISKISIFLKIISLILILFFVKNKEDYKKYAAIVVFSTSGGALIYFLELRKYIELTSITKIKLELEKHIKPIFTFFLMATTITLYTNLDTMLLGFFSTEEEVGFYVTALKIKNILVTIITSFGAVLLPRLSYYITQKKIRDYRRIIKQSLNYILIISIPVTIYFILFSKLTILILAGEAYFKSILLMQVLLPTVICIGLTNLIGIQIMVPMHLEKKLLMTVIFGAIIDLIINILLISSLASLASAIATLLAEIVVLILQVSIMKNMIKRLIDRKALIQIIVFSTISGLIVSNIKLFTFNYIIQFILSGITFFLILLFLLLIFKNSIILEILKIKELNKNS